MKSRKLLYERPIQLLCFAGILLCIVWIVISHKNNDDDAIPDESLSLSPPTATKPFLIPRKVPLEEEEQQSVCVVVRTGADHRLSIRSVVETLFQSLDEYSTAARSQSNSSRQNATINLEVYVLNFIRFDDDAYVKKVEAMLTSYVAEWTARWPAHHTQVVYKSQLPISPRLVQMRDSNGYVLTDFALELILRQLQHSPRCSHFIVTNGDNLYGKAFFSHVMPEIHAKKKVVAVSFVSRYTHFQERNPNFFVLGGLDLGTVVFSRECAKNYTFFREKAMNRKLGKRRPLSLLTGPQVDTKLWEDISDADFFAHCTQRMEPQHISRIDKVLFYHQ